MKNLFPVLKKELDKKPHLSAEGKLIKWCELTSAELHRLILTVNLAQNEIISTVEEIT